MPGSYSQTRASRLTQVKRLVDVDSLKAFPLLSCFVVLSLIKVKNGLDVMTLVSTSIIGLRRLNGAPLPFGFLADERRRTAL